MKRSFFAEPASLVALLLFLTTCNTTAIPAFARKYQISCQVCHTPVFPRLKGFGDEFAGRGFRLTEYESPRYFIPVGDDRLSLFRELPVAVRIDGFVSYNFDNQKKSDFSAPYVLKILSGGEISDKLSYYFYFLMNERGSIAGVEDAFLMYHDLLSTGMNLYVGQFQVSDPLFKGELRYTMEPYKIYDVSPGNSSVNLKYDRGIIIDREFKSGTTITAELVNGCGIGEAFEGHLFDKDKYKNFMLRITQDIGKKVGVGIFGYSGKELLSGPLFFSQEGINKIQMIGPDLTVNLDEKLFLNVQYVWRSDSRVFTPSLGMPVTDIQTRGGFAEIIYSPKGDRSKWYLTGLVNVVDSEQNELDYQSATLHAGYLLRRNLRIVAEYTQQFSGTSYGRVNTGFVAGF